MFKKFLKVGAISLVVIMVLIIVSLLVIVYFINPNQFKPIIIKTVDSATGRHLVLDGDISWKIYPRIGLHLTKFSLSNPDGFNSNKFVYANSVDVSVDLLPLLKNNIIVNNVAIDGLNTYLIKQNGINNWTFNTTAESITATSNEPSEVKPLKLELNSFSMTNSSIKYSDLDKKIDKELKNFNLLVNTDLDGVIRFDKTQDKLELHKVNINFNDYLQGHVDISVSNLSNPIYSGKVNFNDIKLNKLLNFFNVATKERNGITILDNLDFSTSIDGNDNTLKLNNFHINLIKQLNINSNIMVTNLSHQPIVSGDFSSGKFSLNKILDGLNIAKSSRKNNKLLDNVQISSKFNITPDIIKLDSFKFNFIDAINGALNINISDFDNPQYVGSFTTGQFSLNNIIDRMGMKKLPIINQSLFNKVSFNTNFVGSAKDVSLNQMKLKFADSTLLGSVKVKSFKPIVLDNDLTLDHLDVADFVVANGFKIPLTQLKLNGSLDIGGGGTSTMNANQKLQIQNITLLGMNVDQLAKKIDIIINKAGELNNGGDITTIILNSTQVVQSVQKIQDEVTNSLKPSARDFSQKTNLGILNANINLKNGIIKPSSFNLSGPSAIITGSGQVNLNKNNLNYTIQSKLLVAGINPIFKKMMFPSTLNGEFSNLSVTMDWGSIQRQFISYLVDSQRRQVTDRINQQINDKISKQITPATQKQIDNISKEAGNALQNLLGQ